MSLLLGWGAYARDKNTSARLCAKKAGGGGGGLMREGAYLRDTTVLIMCIVYQLQMLKAGLRLQQCTFQTVTLWAWAHGPGYKSRIL